MGAWQVLCQNQGVQSLQTDGEICRPQATEILNMSLSLCRHANKMIWQKKSLHIWLNWTDCGFLTVLVLFCHSLFFSPFCCILRGFNPSGGGGRNLKPPKINYYTNPFSQGQALQMYESISFSLFLFSGYWWGIQQRQVSVLALDFVIRVVLPPPHAEHWLLSNLPPAAVPRRLCILRTR